MDISNTRRDLVRCGSQLSERNLVWGHSGNVSARADPGTFLISAGGTDLGNLTEGDLVRCRIDDDSWEGSKRPSMETGLHRGIYRECRDAGAVIHSQPLHATAVACSDLQVRTDFLPEAMAYLGRVERVPYQHAGSAALATATAAMAPKSQVLLLDNHGAVCWASSLDQALLLTETLEFVCRLLALSCPGGLPFRYLGEEVMVDFHRHLRSIGRLS